MPDILLIGGGRDGDVFRTPPLSYLDQDQVITLPDPPKSVEWQYENVTQGPVEMRVSQYKVCKLHLAENGVRQPGTVLAFGYSVDITPSEALVMLMQHYQNKGTDR